MTRAPHIVPRHRHHSTARSGAHLRHRHHSSARSGAHLRHPHNHDASAPSGAEIRHHRGERESRAAPPAATRHGAAPSTAVDITGEHITPAIAAYAGQNGHGPDFTGLTVAQQAVVWAAHAGRVASGEISVEHQEYMSSSIVEFESTNSYNDKNSGEEVDDEDDPNACSQYIPSFVLRCRAHRGFDSSARRPLHVARMTASNARMTGTTTRSMSVRRSDLHPTPDERYVAAPRNCRWQILRGIDATVAPRPVVAEYRRRFLGTPRTAVREGIVGWGLFVLDFVASGSIIIEYTGNRVQRCDVDTLKRALDYYGISSNTLISVPSEGSVIDPRHSGGDARYVNNSCSPNCELHEIKLGSDRVVAALSVIRDIQPNTECLMKYKWKTGLTNKPHKCYCGSSACDGTI